MSFVLRIHEERPDVARAGVADGEADNRAMLFSDPPPACALDDLNVVFLADGARRQPVLAHGQADAVHRRNVCPLRLPDH
jgi:hypothetical protein